MKMFTISGLFLICMMAGQVFSQVQPDNPNLDQVPGYLRERLATTHDAPNAPSAVVTIGNWDNFSLGVDFAENNMATDPNHPTWFFTAYNTNAPHHTENGIDWAINAANFGATMQGDPVVAYDSIGNLFYENMYGSSITGCKVIVSTNNGVTWGPSVTAIAGNDKNWICCDQTNGPFANYVYSTMTNGAPPGNFTRSTDHGLTWTSTFSPSTQTLPGMMVCVGAKGNVPGGAVHVVTNSGSSFQSTYTFYLSTDGGATFNQKSAQQFSNTVGTQVSGRNSVSNMRTRPYPMIAADNSYGQHRGRLYCVYASNDPPGNNSKSDVWCRYSDDDGTTWSSGVKINDDPNTTSYQQWHPAIWCDKETGRLYAMWMDTRDTPTNDSALIYASYSDDGGATFVANQSISNAKMKIDCPSCGGGGTPRYEGDYNGVVSNKNVSMIGWTDFRNGNFQSMTAYFPDYAMALDKTTDTLFSPVGLTTISVNIPDVKLYTDSVIVSASINPTPSQGTITFSYPSGNSANTFPASIPVQLVLNGSVPTGTYQVTFIATGPNGTPAHKRICMIKVMPGSTFYVTTSALPGTLCPGQTSQLNATVFGGTSPYTYLWTPAETLSNPGIQNPVATPSVNTMYHVTVTDNASHVTQDSIEVKVKNYPATPGPVVGSQNVCSGATATYSIIEVSGATYYSWTVPTGAQIIGKQDSLSIQVQWGTTTGNILVYAENSCGHNGVPSVLAVTVDTPPTALVPVNGPDAVCESATAKFFTAPTDNSLTYNWTVPADATLTSGQGSDTIYVVWGHSAGDVSVYAFNECGQTSPVTKSVALNTPPGAAGTIAGQDTVCQGHGNYQYTVDQISGATLYVWTLPQDVVISAGQGTNQVTLTIGQTAASGNLSVKGQNDCGEGSESVKALVVNSCAGIDRKNLESEVQLYPNPVNDELTLKINGKEKQLDLVIIDRTGKIRYAETLTGLPASYSRKLDVSAFAKGIYLVRLSNGNRVYSEKLVIR